MSLAGASDDVRDVVRRPFPGEAQTILGIDDAFDRVVVDRATADRLRG